MKKNNASDFDFIVLQRVRFWIEKNTTRKILNWKFFNICDFERMFASKKSRFGSFYSVKTKYFAFFVLFFKKHEFESKISLQVRFGIEKKQRVRFWKNFFSSCQIPNKKFKRVRLWNKIFHLFQS